MSDVFISYASEDRTRVQPIVEQLQDQGWSVWWDRDIAVGAGFEQTIDEQIQVRSANPSQSTSAASYTLTVPCRLCSAPSPE
jgi:hypothetical protein